MALIIVFLLGIIIACIACHCNHGRKIKVLKKKIQKIKEKNKVANSESTEFLIDVISSSRSPWFELNVALPD